MSLLTSSCRRVPLPTLALLTLSISCSQATGQSVGAHDEACDGGDECTAPGQPECVQDEACDDGNECTADTCNNGLCAHEALPGVSCSSATLGICALSDGGAVFCLAGVGGSCVADADCAVGSCVCLDAGCNDRACGPSPCDCQLDVNGDGVCDGELAAGVGDARDSCGAGFACDGLGGCSSFAHELVVVPAGTFIMGSPPTEPGRSAYEGAQHTVTLSRALWVQGTEVSQAEWQALMGNNPSTFASCAACPVDGVNWWDALEYANRLSILKGLASCYTLAGCSGSPGAGMTCLSVTFSGLDCTGFRLPTEAEWEYLARAGTETAFWNGDITALECDDVTVDAMGWYCGNAADNPHAVGDKPANAWGIHDTSGNVSEWVWDSCAASGPTQYSPTAVIDPVNEGGTHRLLRGGTWGSFASGCRSATRYHLPPDARSYVVGFRVVRTGL